MTATKSFGVSGREGHDSSTFYARNLEEWNPSSESEVQDCAVRNQILNRSSENMEDIPDNSVSLVVTSPPYHVGKEYDMQDSFEEFLGMLRRVFTESHRVLEPGGRAVINVANLGRKPYIPLSHIVSSMMLEIGFWMRGEIIWLKGRFTTNGGLGASGNCAWGSYRKANNPVVRDIHEYCLLFSKGRPDRVRKGESTISKERFVEDTLSVWTIQPESARRIGHPAPFPVELPRRFIELYTFKGDLVLDPFMGSGTTAVACLETARDYLGFELSQDYCDVAERRIAKWHVAHSQPSLFFNDSL